MSIEKHVANQLEEVAKSLGEATIRLNDMTHQRSFEIIKKRITRAEDDISSLKKSVEKFQEKTLLERDSTEKDFSGLRALVFSSFVLSFVCLAGIVLLSTKI